LSSQSGSSEASATGGVVCSSVLAVLQKIRDAPGHMGCDIGGTLAKIVLALPPEEAASYHFPEKFGKSGRAHHDLEFEFVLADGAQFVLRFLSGSTCQMEQAVQHLSIRRRDSQRKNHSELMEAVANADSPRLGTSAPQSPRSRPAAPVEPTSPKLPTCRFARLMSDWSDEVFSSFDRPIRRMATAGGGACKFAPLFRDALRVEMVPVKELAAVVDGMMFLAYQRRCNGSQVAEVNDGADLFTIGENGEGLPLPWPDPLFPLILVNMGSGVSILRVDSAEEGDFVRVGGTACGGGTFLGLARALTSATTFDEALELAAAGDAKHADKLVSDIYGEEGCANLGLPGTHTASNFAKLGDMAPGSSCSEKDLARSLLQMVTQQSVLLASAFARHAGCIDRVFFVGGFVDEPNWMARERIAANFRGLGGCAYFLKHSDFLGALGSLRCALKVLEDGDGQ